MQPKEVAKTIINQMNAEKHPRLMLTGPIAVGKTTIAKKIASALPNTKHIEHDLLKSLDNMPCSPKRFNPENCFSPHIETCKSGFIIDIGGGSVFRSNVDKNDRLQQILGFKKKYNVKVILLHATLEALKERYLNFKDSVEDQFEIDIQEWEPIEKPFWRQCADEEIDTT